MRQPLTIYQHLGERNPARRDWSARDGDEDGLPVVGLIHHDERNHARAVALVLALIDLDRELRNNGGHVFARFPLWVSDPIGCPFLLYWVCFDLHQIPLNDRSVIFAPELMSVSFLAVCGQWCAYL